MTKQITPIDIYNSTWGDALDRVNELIDAANTEFVTIGGVNEGNVSITGTLEANNLGIDNFNANTATAAVVHAGTLDANTIAANTLTVNVATITNANVSANVSANVVGGNYVVANTILAGATYDANGALVNANTLINKDNIVTPVLAANIIQVTGTLLVESIGQNFTANVATFSRVNSNTVDAGTVNANTIRVNNKDNLQKISLVDYLPSRVLGTDANTNIIQYAISVFGQSILSSPNAANTRALIGLDQINNTSDAAKPISIATQAALDLKTDKATRVNVGPGLAGGGALAANVTISFNANTIASLAKADSAVQGNSAALVPSGGVFGQVLMKQSTDPYDYAWTTSAITTAVQFVPQTLTPEQQAQGRENLGLGTALSDYVRRDGGSQITGELRTTSQNGLRIQHTASNTSLILRYDGNDGYILVANSTTGSYNTLRPIRINYATGLVTLGNGATIDNGLTVSSGGIDVTGGINAGIQTITGSITHNIGAGYLDIGSYNTTSYGSGYGRFWWNNNSQTMTMQSATSGQLANLYVAGKITAGGDLYAGATGRLEGQNGNLWGNLWTGGHLWAHLGSTAMRAYPKRSDGGAINFAWSGQSGQPTWLWGGTDGNNMYVYNPSNFSVNYASSAGNASTVGGWSQATISNQIESRAAAYADDRFSRAVKLDTSWQTIGAGAGAGGGQNALYITINSDGYPIVFTDRGTTRGSIRMISQSIQYLTSSDGRLKENIRQIVNKTIDTSNLPESLQRLFEYNWVEYDWIGTTFKKHRGVIADQVQSVIPFAVDGEKDAVEEDGSIKAQSVDYSKMVPDIGAGLQDLTQIVVKQQELIAALERKIEALEQKVGK